MSNAPKVQTDAAGSTNLPLTDVTIRDRAGQVLWQGQAINLAAGIKAARDSGADLTKANLRYTNLTGTNLSGANLGSADLRYANLTGTNLSGADLSNADLSNADLNATDLADADLTGADLTGANLRSADLSGANLSGANLRDTSLNDAPIIQDIHSAVYTAAGAPGALNMRTWHCGTTRCRAGWVVTLAGPAGAELENRIGTGPAAALIYLASDPQRFQTEPLPDFRASNEDALSDMARMAGMTLYTR